MIQGDKIHKEKTSTVPTVVWTPVLQAQYPSCTVWWRQLIQLTTPCRLRTCSSDPEPILQQTARSVRNFNCPRCSGDAKEHISNLLHHLFSFQHLKKNLFWRHLLIKNMFWHIFNAEFHQKILFKRILLLYNRSEFFLSDFTYTFMLKLIQTSTLMVEQNGW